MIRLNCIVVFLAKALRVLCRQYKLYLFFGILIVCIQLYSGYYLYKEVLSNENFGLKTTVNILKEYELPKIKNESLEELSKKNLKKPYNDSFDFIEDLQKEINVYDYGIELPCHIDSTEVISALQRAKTQKCKKIIANISCEIKFGRFYPSRLTSICPSDGFTRGKYMGCYIDDRENRVLSGHMLQLKKNSPAICSDICFQRGYIYSGVQYSKECFCGSQELPQNNIVSNSECNMSCSGDLSNTDSCGGFLRIDVFQTGLMKTKPKALKRPTTSDGPPVRIAYILTVNGRSLRQVHRLLKALYHKDHFFFIHVDARQSYLFRELSSLEAPFANIKISRLRFSSIWGGASLLSVLLHSMEQLLLVSDWDFVINLSESDFPIKSNDALVQFLTANRDRNFLKSHGQDTNKFLKKQGLDRTFLECEKRMWRIGERKLPLGIRIDGGSDWLCLNRQFVKYLVESRGQLVTGLKKVFAYTLLPGESFFHTVLRNSELCHSFADNNLHVTNWKRKLGCRCQYKHIVDWCGCSPNDFVPSDLSKLEMSKSRNLYFARKFEPVVSVEVINIVEEWLYGSYDPETPNLRSHWENRFHYLDTEPSSDNAAITLYHSVSRLSLFGHCPSVSVNLLQAFSFHKNDKFQGIVVEIEASQGSSHEVLQSFVQFKELQNISSTGVSFNRLLKLEVNKNFDQKEQMFRNFENSLGPEDDLVVASWWESSETATSPEVFKPNILLLDPVGAVAATAELVVVEDTGVLDNSFQLEHPLRPGVWIAYVILGAEVIGSRSFTILPLEFRNDLVLSVEEARSLHEGPISPYSAIDPNFIFTLPINSHPFPGHPTLVKSAKEKASSHGYALQQWIDQLVKGIYELKGVCLISSELNASSECLSGRDVPTCSETSWSSHSPDPKTFLGNVNPLTGRFEDSYRVS